LGPVNKQLGSRTDEQLFVHVVNRNFEKEYSLDLNLADDISVLGNYKRYTLSGDKSARIRNKDLSQIANIRGDTFENGSREMKVYRD